MIPNVSSTGGSAPERAAILIVDDDSGAVEVFEEILTANGYSVRVAGDAAAGLREVQRAVPAVIVLDLHLPTDDGVEFLRQLRAVAPNARMPIVLVTGDYFIDEDVAREIRTLGARLHFKPLWEEELLKLIHDLLESEAA